MGPLAKYSTFIASIIVTTIIFGIFGILLNKLFYKFNLNQYILKFVSSFTLTYGILILISILMVTIIQVRSGSQTISIQLVILSLIPSQIVYGLILPLFLRKPKDKNIKSTAKSYQQQPQPINENIKDEKNYNRRDFLRLLFASVISIPIIYFGLNRLLSPLQDTEQPQIQSNISSLLQSRSQQQSGSIPTEFKDPSLAPLLGSEITPTYLFYRIDINPIVPE